MRVHVTLARALLADPAARRAALSRVLEAGCMRLGNPRRFEAYGIITGEARAERLDRLRAIPDVEAVELDEDERV